MNFNTGTLAVLAGVGLLTLIASSLITRPIPRLSASMQAIAEGRLETEVPYTGHGNEIGAMARNVEVPLALSNLAAREQIGAAHIHITRHLALKGSRLTELAAAAGMSKQAMGDLVTQCEAWDLVRREPDPLDARARRIVFTATGLLWLEAFRLAVAQAEAEFRAQVGSDVATVVALGLEAYGG